MVELVLRLVLSLALVLGIFWSVARFGARRMQGGRSVLQVRGRQSLSRSASVAVVEVGGRILVVGVSDGGVQLLTELEPDALEQPEGASAAQGVAPRHAAAREPVSPSALGGSLLAPATWRQAWQAATRTPVPARGQSSSHGST